MHPDEHVRLDEGLDMDVDRPGGGGDPGWMAHRFSLMLRLQHQVVQDAVWQVHVLSGDETGNLSVVG